MSNPIIPLTKTCTKCGKTFPATTEYFDKNGKCLRSHCKPCRHQVCREYNNRQEVKRRHAEYAKEYYANNSEQLKEGSAAYQKTEQGKINASARRKKNRFKHRAQKAVFRAVIHGEIPYVRTQQCLKCGKSASEYHHYLGYERKHWLDVIPLCKRCHADIHRKVKL